MTDTPQTMHSGAETVLARAKASPARRGVGLLSLAGLGLLLIYSALTRSPDPGWQIALALVGLGFIGIAELMRRSTASGVELTNEALRDADGRVIVRIDEIARIDQGLSRSNPQTVSCSRPTAAWRGAGAWACGGALAAVLVLVA
ncbi:hypothetical protein [Sulfitobacter profundi]|uniref:Uncharacterized protein n=1 Tax=Sulfitobacter profundi TaxID=2679961 RepID=A0ABW1YTT0_9RHOB